MACIPLIEHLRMLLIIEEEIIMSIYKELGQALKTIHKGHLKGEEAISLLSRENAYLEGAIANGYSDADGRLYEQIKTNDRVIYNLESSAKNQNNNENGGKKMFVYTPPEPKTYKEELFTSANTVGNRGKVIVRNTNGLSDEYPRLSYNSVNDLVNDILADYPKHKYVTSKTIDDDVTIVVTLVSSTIKEEDNHTAKIDKDNYDISVHIGNPIDHYGFKLLGSKIFSKVSFLTICIGDKSEAMELKKYKRNGFSALANACTEMVGDAKCISMDESLAEQLIIKFEKKEGTVMETNKNVNVNDSNKNNEGDVNMTNYKSMKKAELIEVLTANGVVVNSKTKRDELLARVLEVVSNKEVATVTGRVPEVLVQTQLDDSLFQPQVGQDYSLQSLADLMITAMNTNISGTINTSVKEVVVPAVTTVVEDGNAKVLAELKSQLDKMNATIAGLANGGVRTQGAQGNRPNNQSARVSVGVCEDCGANITNANVVSYSKSHCGGHVYCYNHQAAHKTYQKVPFTNTDSNYGFNNQANNQQPQQPTGGVILKPCMCCGNNAKYANQAALEASTEKAQKAGLKAIICKKCADKILAERAAASQQQTTQQPPVIDGGIPQMPGSGFVPSENPLGFDPNKAQF